MGRAIVRDPAVFLFDEPLSNLDAKLRVQMRAEIKGLHARLGTTTIYVTHDQVEAMTMADRIVVMHSGIGKQTAAPLELEDRPENLFVAGFIGSPSMTFLRGSIVGGDFRDGSGTDWRVGRPTAAASPEGMSAVLGIRPAHIRLDPHGLAARNYVVEPTGSETQLGVDVNGQIVTCVVGERISVKAGETILISPDQAMSHLFDETRGKRLQ